MSKKQCYFKCNNTGFLYRFPPVTYNSYEKYCQWKKVLRKEDQEKDDHYIVSNIKLCSNHFEDFYFTQAKRLTRHAIPTINIVSDTSADQEELLCTLIEENPEVINDCDGIDELKYIETKLKEWTPRLNAYGPHRTYNGWEKYIFEVMTKLKTKRVEWIDGPKPGMQLVGNNQDFTDLELKMLDLWNKSCVPQCSSPTQTEIYSEEEYEIQMEECEESETNNEIVTVTLNIDSDGPLLQAAAIASSNSSKGPQRSLNKVSNHYGDEVHDRFELFGKDIAQQLRCMPLDVALETERLLKSVLRSKKARLLNNTFL